MPEKQLPVKRHKQAIQDPQQHKFSTYSTVRQTFKRNAPLAGG
jgi:hypothetical protein